MKKKTRQAIKKAKPKQPFDLSERDCSSDIHGFLNPMEAAKY